ncbi:type II toxin-antitoxin system PemK/MazF family toxin [Planomicrobium okeanokoites]|uniref:type II toxin-antitoxin system PemK/MazF family toxin n=1 Tax=Planomicrobium okeanokoites TaxID=244 RepID=UPI00249295A4|nr:type II toxin-antitoxin system PemK/MazF family toxin [Planomicrobium okeanokoites]
MTKENVQKTIVAPKKNKTVDLNITHEKFKEVLNQYVESNKDHTDGEIVYTAHTFIDWLEKKTNIVKDEKTFTITPEQKATIKRTHVVWIDFGFNIADEFGGKHPAIIYRPSGNQVFVFPLTTQPPTSRNKHLFVKINYIKNFKKMDRWVNILNLKCVSIQRIDFNSGVGEVNGKVMNDLSTAWKNQGIR